MYIIILHQRRFGGGGGTCRISVWLCL